MRSTRGVPAFYVLHMADPTMQALPMSLSLSFSLSLSLSLSLFLIIELNWIKSGSIGILFFLHCCPFEQPGEDFNMLSSFDTVLALDVGEMWGI